MVEAVTIHDMRSIGEYKYLAYDLIDLITMAGKEALDSVWTCEMVEFLGPNAELLYKATEDGPVHGLRLVELAKGVTQTIDGMFIAVSPGQNRPWLVLRAIDGCYFVVITESNALMTAIRERFTDIRQSVDDALWYVQEYPSSV